MQNYTRNTSPSTQTYSCGPNKSLPSYIQKLCPCSIIPQLPPDALHKILFRFLLFVSIFAAPNSIGCQSLSAPFFSPATFVLLHLVNTRSSTSMQPANFHSFHAMSSGHVASTFVILSVFVCLEIEFLLLK